MSQLAQGIEIFLEIGDIVVNRDIATCEKMLKVQAIHGRESAGVTNEADRTIIDEDRLCFRRPPTMEPTKELVDEIYRERVRRARSTPIDQKFLAGADLFEYACRLTCDGIRYQNPGIDEARVQEILRERLALARRLERRP